MAFTMLSDSAVPDGVYAAVGQIAIDAKWAEHASPELEHLGTQP